MNQVEIQLTELRERLSEIKIAKKWLTEFRVNAPPAVSAALSCYYTYLVEQESKTTAMGKRLKSEAAKHE